MAEKKEAVLSLNDLEKSWSDSKALLKSILDDDTAVLSKAKKEEAEEEDEEVDFDDEMDDAHEDGETEEEEDEEEKSKIKKSLSDEMESDEDSAAAMDVEPFLRRMVKSMSKKFSAIEAENRKLSNVLAKSLMVIGEQNLTIANQVRELSEAPVPSRSTIRKSMDKFPANESKNELLKSMTVDQVLEKAVSLSKTGKLTSLDVAKIQNRLNKGIELNSEYVALLTKEDK